MKPRAVVLALFGAAVFAHSSSHAASARQDGPKTPKAPPVMVIQIGLDVIQIDASVTDRSGHPIGDLGPDDFTLEVDGQIQRITNAAYFGARPTKGGGAAESISPPGVKVADDNRTVAFIVDDLNMSLASMHATRQALNRFAKDWGATNAGVALRSTSDQSRAFSLFRSHDPFVRAVGALRYNIRSNQGASSVRPVRSSVNASSRLSPGEEAMLATNPSMALENLQQRVFSLISTINTLRSLPGRKAVVFVSEGFSVEGQDQNQLGFSSPFYSLFDDANISAALRMITEVANRASVVLYTVDPRGLVVDFPGAADDLAPSQVSDVMNSRWQARVLSQGTLQQLADDTGGLSVANRNDLEGGFGDVLLDQGSYYLIGFEPPSKTFTKVRGRPKFHKIKLTVNRPGVRVRTRAGFYGVTDQEVIDRAPVTPLSPNP